LFILAGIVGSRSRGLLAVDSSDAIITEVLVQQQTAWNQGDIPAFMKGYWNSPELSFSGSSGISRGWQAVLARYQKNYPEQAAMGHLEFSELQIHPLGDSAAMVLGKWHLQRSGGDIGGVFTLVFQKFPDGWKIIHDHTSQVLPPGK
jgi:beta-aspartyl-peptidase (threonine type)